MTTRAAWLALAERCEQATEPDRELDAAIMFDAFAVPVGTLSDGGPRGYLWPADNPSWNFGLRFPGKDREWFAKTLRGDGKEALLIERDGALVLMNDLRIPRLTKSLDAITALIERELPGCGWVVDRSPSDARVAGMALLPEAQIIQHGDMWTYDGWPKCNAATPALALCAAFCRAMADREGA